MVLNVWLLVSETRPRALIVAQYRKREEGRYKDCVSLRLVWPALKRSSSVSIPLCRLRLFESMYVCYMCDVCECDCVCFCVCVAGGWGGKFVCKRQCCRPPLPLSWICIPSPACCNELWELQVERVNVNARARGVSAPAWALFFFFLLFTFPLALLIFC